MSQKRKKTSFLSLQCYSVWNLNNLDGHRRNCLVGSNIVHDRCTVSVQKTERDAGKNSGNDKDQGQNNVCEHPRNVPKNWERGGRSRKFWSIFCSHSEHHLTKFTRERHVVTPRVLGIAAYLIRVWQLASLLPRWPAGNAPRPNILGAV
eukprot:1422916-Rhodomonas_salina.1